MEIQRPLDSINQTKGKRVLVELKNGKKFEGKLVAFDIHLNIVLEDVIEYDQEKKKYPWIFLRGDMVMILKPLE